MTEPDHETAVNSSRTSVMARSEKAPSVRQALDDSSPIVEIYLTFDTELPGPPTDDGPACPDLKPYTNPFLWSPARKTVHLFLSCIATLVTAYAAGAYSPPIGAMVHDFHSRRIVVVVGITTFCIGFGIAPMALAPLSEAWGRYPILVVSGFVFLVFQAVCSVMVDAPGIIVSRLFVGIGASVFSAILGGVIADLWQKEERNTPMALFSGAVLFGSGAGPLVSSAMGEYIKDRTLYWKWTFWHQVIVDAVLLLSLIFFFNETRGSVVLSRKARCLNKWYESLEAVGVYGVWVHQSDLEHNAKIPVTSTPNAGVVSSSDTLRASSASHRLHRIRWVVKSDELRPTLLDLVTTSVKRPFVMLFTEPVVFCFSLWAAFAWGILYIAIAFVPFLYSDNYSMSSRVYIALMVASIVAAAAGIMMDWLLLLPQWRSAGPHNDSKFWAFIRHRFPAEAPESRLYFACFTTLLLPAGIFIAFVVPDSWRPYGQAIGIGFGTWGIYSVYLATFNYLADSYHIYASSALAAQSLARNLMGGIFPIISMPLFGNLGLNNAGYILGSVASLLTVTPWVLMFFGSRIRAKSKLAMVSFLV